MRQELLADEGWRMTVIDIDSTILEIAKGIVRTLRHLRKNDPNVYLSMSNPPHPNIVGLVVSFFTSTPWLYEIRDPLVTIPEIDETSVSGQIRKVLEAAAVQRAQQVVWLDGIQMEDDYLEETYGARVDPNWYKLPFLGYRASNFEDINSAQFEPFTVTYAGSFYEGWVEPYSFLDGFAQFVEQWELSPKEAKFLVYGDWSKKYSQAVEERGLSAYVTTHDFVPHEELLPVLKGSDVVLYIGGENPQNRLSVPSKIWDYVGVQRPILAVADSEFRSAEFVKKERLGLVSNPSDVDDIAATLGTFYNGEFEYDPEGNDRFRRERNVSELIEVLNSMVEGETKHGYWDGT